ncbi:NAD(P)H-dependent oxidoreductase [Hyphomicrobium sp.]|uniref:NAD(P)H-dependent oxidoreductase n=1 Tax=Hyphomicrobium sp. TaxID=82 RepID=UPI002FE3EF0A
MVRINGSPSVHSRTAVLIDAVSRAIADALPVEDHGISLAATGRDIMSGLTRLDISPEGEKAVQLAERADLLIVGTPIFRASYTGLLKHFFDLVDIDAMRGRKVVLCATGGSTMHGLVLEHQLRPLMSFFSMMTVPTTLYAVGEDVQDGKIANVLLRARIDRVVSEVRSLFAHADCGELSEAS